MKKNKIMTLAVTLACSMALGITPPVKDVKGLPAFSVTAEAASKKLTVNVSGKTIYAGKTANLGAKVTQGAKITYKSSNKNIASINAKGVLTGRKPGTARITLTVKKAKYKTVKKTVKIKVVKQPQSISAANKTVTVGKSVNLGAKGKTTLTYKSSNTKVATVDKKGNVKAVAAGTAKITVSATANGIYTGASKTITVKVNKLSQSISASNLTLTAGQGKNLNAKAKTALSYKSSNTKVATIDKKGNVKAVGAGTAKITISAAASNIYDKASRTITVKVVKKPDTPSKTPETEAPKETEKPNQTEKPKPDVSYVTRVYFSESYKSNILYVGESKKSTLKWEATGKTTLKDFVFTSSDPSIATVDANGTITGVSAGTVRITAKSKTPFSSLGSAPEDYFSATQKYQIKIRTSKVDSIGYPVITGGEAVKEKNISIGETKECTLEINSMEDAGVDDVEFISSDPSVATVDAKGNVTGISKGYVTITAKTKLPSAMDGVTIMTDSTTYHVGDYTYEEILNGLTIDTEAGWSAHETMNDLRQNPSHRNFFKNYPSYPEREWDTTLLRSAATRASRNIVCYILGGWIDGEKSSRNPLASHKGALNGYGGAGWENTGAELGKAASVFFDDAGHFGNETDSHYKYEAIAVVQYKNPAGVNLTSMIVQAGTYKEKTVLSEELRVGCMPKAQFMDFCNHFGLPTTDPKVTDEQTLTVEELLPVEDTTEATTEVPEDVIIQEEDTDTEPEMIIEEETDTEPEMVIEEETAEIIDEAVEDETEMEVLDEVPEELLEEEITE